MYDYPLQHAPFINKFTGKERETESGLDHTLHREYTSSYGRWMTPDPENAGADPGDPQTWNMYAYVRNNPTTLTDPDGTDYNVCTN